jgi:hypothetical protein
MDHFQSILAKKLQQKKSNYAAAKQLHYFARPDCCLRAVAQNERHGFVPQKKSRHNTTKPTADTIKRDFFKNCPVGGRPGSQLPLK